MNIVADENIPLLDQFFSDIGSIHRVPGRSMSRNDLKDAEILLVRSVTGVNAELLSGSSVKFVGTATIGTDHIDTGWLNEHKIGFGSAPGCNAQAVVDYVLSALSVLVDARGIAFQELSVGIIGVGNVGGLLMERLSEMGLQVKAYDPFQATCNERPLTTFEDTIDADVVTLHTPLTTTGSHPTHHMIDADKLKEMRPDGCLINASRGAVVNNSDLLDHLKAYPEFCAVIDVWENEPEINLELLDWVALGTPHIAGYSLDGKMRGTEYVYQAVCDYFGIPQRLKLAQFLPEPGIKRVNFTDQVPVNQALRTALRAAYEIRVDDGVMRSAMRKTSNMRETFDHLRKNYPLRRDTPTLRVGIPSRSHELSKTLNAAGFDVRLK